jgi:IPT/TIG domain
MQMINSFLIAALLLASALAGTLRGQGVVPLVRTVDPVSGTGGDVFTVTGDNLDQATVAAVFLTDGKNDVKVAITEQTEISVKFQVPAGIGNGRYAVMILTKGKDAKFIEEPVKVTIEPPKPGPTSVTG